MPVRSSHVTAAWRATLTRYRHQVTMRSIARFGITAITVITLAAVLAPLTGCMRMSRAPQDLDYARTRTSTGGTYRATIRPEGDSIPVGKLQRWTLHLETASGTPVDSARIAVDGGMPQHGHGLPTRPRVTKALGNGTHLVEGMKFNMGGWWVVKFRLQAAEGTDYVQFNLKL